MKKRKVLGTIVFFFLVFVISGCSNTNTSSYKTNSSNVKKDCYCGSNTYNCDNFSTHAEAQALFRCCGGTSNDVHRLDRDGDGLACETLP